MTKHQQIGSIEHTALHREQARRDRVAKYMMRQARISQIRPNMGRLPLIDELRGELSRAAWAANALSDRHHPLNRMLERHSGLRTFAQLIRSHDRDQYRPTLEVSSPERECIADAFEAYTGEPAHRYHSEPARSWTQAGTRVRAGEVSECWYGVVYDARQHGTRFERRYVGPYETEGVARMQAAAAAARLNRKHGQVMELAEQMVDAELAGQTLAQYRADLGLAEQMADEIATRAYQRGAVQ